MPGNQTERDAIIRILRDSREIAVIGLSDDPERPSYDVAQYLQSKGYHIIPVNPRLHEVLGERAYPDLLSIPGPVDVVDIFRRPDAVPDIVDQAIQVGAKAVWMQEGIVHEEAEARARSAGLLVVSDRCMKKETRRLLDEGLLDRTCPSPDPTPEP